MFGLSIVVALSSLFGITVSSSICNNLTTPAFTTQNTTTTNTTDVISGTTSPNVSVAIANNGQNVANITSDSSGDFSVEVSLNIGTNDFSAIASTSCQNSTDTTDLVITRDAVPSSSSPSSSSSTASTTANTVVIAGSATSTTGNTSSATASSTSQTVPTTVGISVPVNIYAPSQAFNQSGSRTTKNTVFVSGSTIPGVHIQIYDNGKLVANLKAAPNGTFGVSIPLVLGVNHIEIKLTYKGHTTIRYLTYIRTAYEAHSSNAVLWWFVGTFIATIVIVFMILAFIKRKFSKDEPNETV